MWEHYWINATSCHAASRGAAFARSRSSPNQANGRGMGRGRLLYSKPWIVSDGCQQALTMLLWSTRSGGMIL